VRVALRRYWFEFSASPDDLLPDLGYGCGALARFERPATVISESPDEESHQAVYAALSATLSSSIVPSRTSARRSAKISAASPRSRSSRN
jgi:predicted aconitase